MKIRYRVWDGYAMDYDMLLDSDGDLYSIGHGGLEPLRARDFVAMLSTGLQDADGKEIFEGDILYTAGVQLGKVVFDRGAFWVNYDGIMRSVWGWRKADSPGCIICKITGNIYENQK